ncbi:MAG: insulinase family protein, partial [Bacteroidetes bacterium]|nr:insulinase family protein [Bacteroidota bacterium]
SNRDSKHAIFAVLTPQSSGKPISRKGFGGAESFAPTKTKSVPLPKWADAAVGRLAVPHSTIHPDTTTLPNGIKLVVQPESISNTITVIGGVKNNPQLEQPKGRDGVADVLDQLFDYGTTTLDRVAFQKALDDIGANESAGTSFSLEVLKNDFRRGVQLLADNELHPALPEQAFKIIQQQTAATVAGQLVSPDYLTRRALNKALLPKGDPVLREETPAKVDSVTLKDVKEYYAKVFRPDMTTIVVIGDVNPDTAKQVIWDYFKTWKASGPKPPTELAPVPLNKPSTAQVPDASRVQDVVYLSEEIAVTRSNPDYYALQLGNHVLGGAFYATRFYRDLRENSGLVYYVGGSLDVYKTRGRYDVVYGCDPDNVAKARTMIIRDLKEMQDTEVTPKELTQARALLLREIPLSESSENSIAYGLLRRTIDGLPLDEPTLAARKYMKLTAKDVEAAFAKWIRPNDFVEVTEGPAPK